jgi:hypothetical protein
MATLRTLLVLLSILAVLPACILVERVEYTPLDEEEPPVPPPPPTPSVPQPRLPMNNSYQGSVHTGVLRPMFRWEASHWDGPETIRYEFQLSIDSSFSTELTEVQTNTLGYQPIENLPVSVRAQPVGARYFWRVRACAESVCSEFSPRWWVNLGRVQRDLNGDGYADMVVVANGGAGHVVGDLYIYGGKLGTNFNGPHSKALIGADQTWFNTSAAIGDFNNDGFADIAAQVTNRDGSNKRVNIYFGSINFYVRDTPDHVLNVINSFSLGDINCDGLDDLAVSLPSSKLGFVLGTRGTPEIIESELSFSGRPAGDLNGDGFSDLMIQAANGADIYFGEKAIPPAPIADGVLVSPPAGGVTFAVSAASAGDINGDGFGDLLVGSTYDATGGQDAGAVYVYLGGAEARFDAEEDGVFTGATGQLLGAGVGSLGDLNHDGYGDIGMVFLNISQQEALRGGLKIRFGRPGKAIVSTIDTELRGVAATNLFGRGFGAGDMNGDEFDDVMIGAPGFAGAENTTPFIGQAYIFLGNTGRSLEPYPDGTITGPVQNAVFGDVAMAHMRFGFF